MAISDNAAAPATPQWSKADLIGFRFTFIFLGTYALQCWRSYWLWGLPGAGVYDALIMNPGNWLGQHCFHLCSIPPGSGADSSPSGFYCWVNQLIWLAVVSAVLALIWTLIDRQRSRHHRKLYQALLIVTRYYLAYIMVSYGEFKLTGQQFSGGMIGPRLFTAIGDMTKQGLMWGTMGTSRIYELFTGMGEVVAGILIFSRRTAALGALLAITLTACITMLDIVHQVSISERAFMYMVMSIFVLLPDWNRVKSLYLTAGPVPPLRPWPPILDRARWPAFNVISPVTKMTVIVLLMGTEMYRLTTGLQSYYSHAPTHELTGFYRVDSVLVNGKTPSVSLNDSTAWYLVDIPSAGRWGPPSDTVLPPTQLVVTTRARTEKYLRISENREGRELKLLRGWMGNTADGVLHYTRVDSTHVRLDGTLARDSVRMLLRLVRKTDAVLYGGKGY